MLRTFLIFTVTLLFFSSLSAQIGDKELKTPNKKLLFDNRLIQKDSDYDKFVKSSGELSNLYRGAAPIEYRFKYTGTYFAYTESYIKGNVLYNGRIYKDISLNLNSHNDDLQINIDNSRLFVTLNKDFVHSFTIGEHKFINVGRSHPTEKKIDAQVSEIIEGVDVNYIDILLPPGYYEIIHDGELKLLKKTKKIYSERINQSASAETKSQIERFFVESITYYLVKDKINRSKITSQEKEVVLIKRKSTLIAQLKSKKSDVRQYIRNANIDYSNKDILFAAILAYYEEKANISKK